MEIIFQNEEDLLKIHVGLINNYCNFMNEITLLGVNDLTVVFHTENQEIKATDGVTFRLDHSETLGIVGESGSGKSVTALAILKLIPLPPAEILSGRVVFNDFPGKEIDLLKISEHELRKIRGMKISMIFQEPMTSLNPVFTCGNQVAESLYHHFNINRKEVKEKVLELFNEVKLPRPGRIYSNYPHELSGGQRQRVMIAMAIACNPKILIADEPTTALDVTVQKEILELLQRIQVNRKMSILFITHDLALVSGFAQRVIVMHKGKIVEEGQVEQLFKHPKHNYTKGLMACRPPLNIRLRRLPTIDDFVYNGVKINEIITQEERSQEHQKIYTMAPILKVRGVKKEFKPPNTFLKGRHKSIPVIDEITFTVYPGETLGIVGESGSGKTTLARTILELIPPSEGSIKYRDIEITRLSARNLKKLRKDLQIIFQDPYSSLNPRRTIGVSIMESMIVHKIFTSNKERKEEALQLLQQVGLNPDHFYRYPHEFSGGQRQRICIARSLAVQPRIIICDEPVSALDVSIQAQVLNLLNDLKSRMGLTYIFISHDLSVVKFMADRLIVMKDGKIVEMGDADQIYAKPSTTYTRMLLEAIPKALRNTDTE